MYQKNSNKRALQTFMKPSMDKLTDICFQHSVAFVELCSLLQSKMRPEKNKWKGNIVFDDNHNNLFIRNVYTDMSMQMGLVSTNQPCSVKQLKNGNIVIVYETEVHEYLVETGTFVRDYSDEEHVHSVFQLDNKNLVFIRKQGVITIWNYTTHKTILKHRYLMDVIHSFLYDDKIIIVEKEFVVVFDKNLRLLSSQVHPFAHELFSASLGRNGLMYYASGHKSVSDTFLAMNYTTGETIWKIPAENITILKIIGEYVLDGDGVVICKLDPNDPKSYPNYVARLPPLTSGADLLETSRNVVGAQMNGEIVLCRLSTGEIIETFGDHGQTSVLYLIE
jgi:hypothetical protein